MCPDRERGLSNYDCVTDYVQVLSDIGIRCGPVV